MAINRSPKALLLLHLVVHVKVPGGWTLKGEKFELFILPCGFIKLEKHCLKHNGWVQGCRLQSGLSVHLVTTCLFRAQLLKVVAILQTRHPVVVAKCIVSILVTIY